MNARFKTVILSALVTMTAFTAITYTSCEPDKCKAIVCANGGVCNDGVCTCQSGYEGPQCEKEVRAKFTGIYTVLEKGTISLTTQYVVSVEKGAKKSDIIIKNFQNNFVSPVNAYVRSDTMFIPQQTIDNRWQVQGIGLIEEDKYYGEHAKLSVRYSVRDLNKPENAPVDDYGLEQGDPSIWNK